MAAQMTRDAVLAAGARALIRNPAWAATGGPRGTRGATESTFTRPIERGVVWYHEDHGQLRMMSADPRLVVDQLQRVASKASQDAGGPGVRVDWVYGPETRAGLLVLANTVAPTDGQTLILNVMERALSRAFHKAEGQVVLPALVELPTFGNQRVAAAPDGHMNAVLIGQDGQPGADQAVRRDAEGAVPPMPTPLGVNVGPQAQPGATVTTQPLPPAQNFQGGTFPQGAFTPAQVEQLRALFANATLTANLQQSGATCNPILALTAVCPGYDPVAWAQMAQADRFKAWERWVGDDPQNRAWPSCTPGGAPTQASLQLVLGQVAAQGGAAPAPTSPQTGLATANATGGAPALPSGPIQWTPARMAAVGAGAAALAYVAYVAVREIRSPSPDPRRNPRR